MNDLILSVISELSAAREGIPFFSRDAARSLPQRDKVTALIKDLRKLLFPGYFSDEDDDFFYAHLLSGIAQNLTEQLVRAYVSSGSTPEEAKASADKVCRAFVAGLPEIRALLAKDVDAIFEGDPAASSREEVVFCYPGIYAIFIYRVAHALFILGAPLIPRIMTEYAHQGTGIDIHAGATIGEYFFIDHGTGIVIGETTVIGDHVKLYQGVTLGGISTRGGRRLTGVKRHPTICSGATIYAGATILGGDTVIGERATIGGNTFITESVEAGSVVTKREN